MEGALQGTARGDNPQVEPASSRERAKEQKKRPGRAGSQAGEKPD